MNNKRYISLLIFFLLFQLIGFSQNQIRIADETGRFIGRFKAQLYQEGSKLTRLRGNFPKVSAEGENVNMILRIEDLRWFEDEDITDDLTIESDQISLSDSRSIRLNSNSDSYTLSPESDEAADIKFKVLADGEFSLSILYTAGESQGKFVQNFSVEGLGENPNSKKGIGSIADIKKAWKETDKKDLEDINRFIARYEGDKLAEEEGLLTIANRTLKRVEQQQQDEQEAWDEVSEGDNQEAISNFLKKYPDSKYAEAAKAKLGLKADVLLKSETKEKLVENSLTKTGKNIYTLALSQSGEVEVKVSHPDDIEIFDSGDNSFELKVKGSKNYDINVTELSSGQRYSFQLNNKLRAQLEQDGKDFVVFIEGGVSPYSVEFYQMGEDEPKVEAIVSDLELDDLNQITLKNRMLSTTGMDGLYEKLVIRDATTTSKVAFPIEANIEHKTTSSRILLLLLLGAIIIGGAIMFFINRKKQSTRQEYLAKAKAMQATQKVQVVQPSNMVQENTGTPKPARKITISKTEKKFVPANGGSDFVSSGKMKITKREVKGGRLTSEEFVEVLKGDKYAFMDLQELWPDTAIKELYLSKECIKALGKFLKEENLDKAIAEMEGAIPEVGGFLMGYHQLDEKTGDIRVTMDEFVPFVPEYHDVFKIEIGTATLVQELGDAQDTHPDKDVIGWFHTHPGHGLFLSNSDLSVQRHFPQKFQIAMEIDSLTKTLDTAFFTRKHDGSINNVEHRKKGAKWFSWKKIEKV